MNNNFLENFNALITGGSKGIGLEITREFLKNSCNVFSLSRSLSDLSIREIKNFHHIDCDITNSDNIIKTVKQIKNDCGKINILVNNSGIIEFGAFENSKFEDINRIIQTNMISSIELTHLLLKDMILDGFGIIINISSISAIQNFPNCAVYNASKAGLLSFSRTLRNEVRKKGIKVIDIIPGATFTEIWDEKVRTKYKDNMIDPAYIAKGIIESLKLSISGKLMFEEIVITPQNGSL